MALAHTDNKLWVLGCFEEKDCGNYFEYAMEEDYQAFELAGKMREFPHRVFVMDNPIFECGYRRALVKKTVAYIVVDEDENGPVIEKWHLKKNNEYVCSKIFTPGERILHKIAN